MIYLKKFYSFTFLDKEELILKFLKGDEQVFHQIDKKTKKCYSNYLPKETLIAPTDKVSRLCFIYNGKIHLWVDL